MFPPDRLPLLDIDAMLLLPVVEEGLPGAENVSELADEKDEKEEEGGCKCFHHYERCHHCMMG